MRNHKNTVLGHPLFILIAILIFLMMGTNSCSESDWNDGICPNATSDMNYVEWREIYT